jgi:uncharacterized protein YjbJ (UPF0337 family)
MTNTSQNMNKAENTNKAEIPDKTIKLNAKIKETWSKLSDDDIKLYSGKRDQFFVKLKEKHGVSKEDAEKVFQEFEAACATSACSTEKTGAVKAA